MWAVVCLVVVQGFKSPLSNQKRNVEDGYGMYQYYLKVTSPTTSAPLALTRLSLRPTEADRHLPRVAHLVVVVLCLLYSLLSSS